MSKKMMTLALAVLFAAPVSQAAVLDTDNAVVASSSGKFKDWSMNFFSLASRPNMEKGEKEQSDRSIFTYDYFSFNYKVDSTQRYSLRVPFGFTSPGYNEKGEKVSEKWEMMDVHFVYSNYDLGYIGDVDLSGKVKFFLPTSESKQLAKTIGYFRFEGYADYALARNWLIAYVFKPEINIQTQTAYVNAYGGKSRTQQAELEHYLQLQWDAHSLVSLTATAGFKDTWQHGSAAENLDSRHYTDLTVGVGAWIRPVRQLSFTVIMSNSTSVVNPSPDAAFGQPENTEFLLLTNYAMF